MPRKERKGPDLHRGGHDHVMNHQYRPVMHDAPHGDYIDHPYHRDHSNSGPEAHKKHRKGGRSDVGGDVTVGSGHKEVSNAPESALTDHNMQQHERGRQAQGKHHHNHGHAHHHPHEGHHHGKNHHYHHRPNDHRKDEWETVQRGLVASASQTSIGSAHGLSFEEASMKMSSVPKKHFMSEQSDAEQLSSEERKTIGNRKIRRQRSQEQQRRDKAVRKQVLFALDKYLSSSAAFR